MDIDNDAMFRLWVTGWFTSTRPYSLEGKQRRADIRAMAAREIDGMAWSDVIKKYCLCGKPHKSQQIPACRKRMSARWRKIRNSLLSGEKASFADLLYWNSRKSKQ